MTIQLDVSINIQDLLEESRFAQTQYLRSQVVGAVCEWASGWGINDVIEGICAGVSASGLNKNEIEKLIERLKELE